MTPWLPLHASPSIIPQSLSLPFHLTAPFKTDLWRPSVDKDANNAPTIYKPIKTKSFKRIAVTISKTTPWKYLYDQAGIVIFWPKSTPSSLDAAEEQNAAGKAQMQRWRWIKAGIEFVHHPSLTPTVNLNPDSEQGQEQRLTPMFSVVACDRYSDWSLHAPLSSPSLEARDQGWKVEIVRKEDSLWVLMDGQKVREVRWAFVNDDADDDGVDKDSVMWIGVMAARPADGHGDGDEQEGLDVGFEGLEVELDDG